MVAEIIIESTVKTLNRIFDYEIPENLNVKIGSRVFVPFGNKKTPEEGIVIGIKEKSDYKIKPILNVQDASIKEEYINLAKWMAKRYICNVSDCLRLMLAPGTTSKNIETREYLLEVVRYVHQNPLKAKIANTDKYKWSSYQEYVYNDKIINSNLILSIFGNTKQEAIKNFIFFHSYNEEKLNDDVEYEMIERLTDDKLKEKIEKLLEINDVREIRTYDTEIRNEKLKKIKEIKGTTKVQLSRVLGINKKMLERVMK